jgi:hypothetical protein
MVERFNGRISDLCQQTRFASSAELEQTLKDYLLAYNHFIPQQAIGHQSPIDALASWYTQHPELFDRPVHTQAKCDTQAARELINSRPDDRQHLDHLCQAKGIGVASAIALLAELAVLPHHLKSAQVSRYAGLDVRLCQSGSSVSRPGRLSKAGNAYLRSALYIPALSAVRFDPNAKAFYQALQKRGKKKIQALCAVMRKYLTGIWACIKLNVPFNSNSLFSPIHPKNP